MKKLFNKLVLSLVCVAIALSSVACGSKSSGSKSSGFALGHFNGNAEDGSMDSRYFYRNDLTVFGGDADVQWVPAERDAEYGGWFYMYTSGNDGVPIQLEADGTKSAVTVLRSRDLNDWELCGAVANGYSVQIEADEWVVQHVWAPEVIYNPTDGKYYMYFNAYAPWRDENPENAEFAPPSYPLDQFDRFMGAVCVSDTPVGPFKLATSERYYGDATQPNKNDKVITNRTPQINIANHFDLDFVFPVIDYSPFFDDNGDLYIYFTRHASTGHEYRSCIWGMKMKDMITPDYDTLRNLTRCSYETVTYDGVGPVWDEDSYTATGYFGAFTAPGEKIIAPQDENGNFLGKDPTKDDSWTRESTVNEGPQMLKVGDRYHIVYSPLGFAYPNYDAKQCIAESPLGPFKKLPDKPGVVMGKNTTNDYMTGTGHQDFVEVDGELFCVYFAHADPFDGETSGSDGRIYAFDRVHVVNDPTYGTLLYGNGPTKSIQPKPYSAIGVKNIAPEAKISATNADKSTIKYLNDELFVTHEYFKDWEFLAKGKTTITLKFDEPRTIGGILIYNSFDYEYAFKQIDRIKFKLAEKPVWYNLKEYTNECYIDNLPFNTDYVSNDGFMRQGGAAVASFYDIKVTQIDIVISEKLGGDGSAIKVSDIVVLGN